MSDVSGNNKRIAKNTLLLYMRTIFLLFISLYTGRVILNALGVEDYGIYNVVGGVVAMFSIVSSALSSSISRFITFELGKGNKERLNLVFITSVNIQIVISLIILLLGEIIGVWFVNNHMNLPEGRLGAANWVLHCSLLMFCINLISVPYNACIIAHERMTVFAYVSILEAVLKLAVCFLIQATPFDRLIFYAVLLVIVAVIIRLVYGIYCGRNFQECRYRFTADISLFKEMGSFGGWSFLTNTAYLFNTQGVNILINLFFGVSFNTARGIATQVDAAIMQFVNNFTTAVNPQITKNYAAGNKGDMFKLICRGSKFSYFLLLLFALPVMFETHYILQLWLKMVPDYTVIFLRLTLIGAMVNMLGNTGITACMATGDIRRYVIWITSIGCLVFPFTWVAFELGMPVESAYIVFIFVYIGVDSVRLYIMKGLLGFPVMMFIKEVIWKITIVTGVAFLPPLWPYLLMQESFLRLLTICCVCTLSSCGTIYFLGLSQNERVFVKKTISKIIDKYIAKVSCK